MRDEITCRVCSGPVRRATRGRPRVYCSRACQAKSYRRRTRDASPPASHRDRATARRIRIVEAVWRIAAEHGLHAASMRRIAAEADVPVRAIQYHFGDKHSLLVEALRLLHVENERHARTRVHFDSADPRIVLRGVLEEFLPLDAPRRRSWRVLSAYYARSLVDQELAEVFHHNDNALEDLVAGLIDLAVQAGRVADGTDARHEAGLLLTGATGLGSDMLHGRRTRAAAVQTLDYHLDKLFGEAADEPIDLRHYGHLFAGVPAARPVVIPVRDPRSRPRLRSRRPRRRSTV